MNKRTKALIEYGKLCGFELDGIDGNEHFVLRHPNGAVHRVPGTPGDYRGDRNSEATMRRLSGVTPPRPNSGKYRRGVRAEKFVPASERVESRSSQIAKLRKQFREVCERIEWCRTEGDREGATEAIAVLTSTEDQVRALGEDPPVWRFRIY